jgi:hypothetical protein
MKSRPIKYEIRYATFTSLTLLPSSQDIVRSPQHYLLEHGVCSLDTRDRFVHPQEKAVRIVLLDAFAKLRNVTNRVMNVWPSISFLGSTPLPMEYL